MAPWSFGAERNVDQPPFGFAQSHLAQDTKIHNFCVRLSSWKGSIANPQLACDPGGQRTEALSPSIELRKLLLMSFILRVQRSNMLIFESS